LAAIKKYRFRFYEFVRYVVMYNMVSNRLCLMTIATWYHSFPSRTGQ
jgi:hypothetical protein